MGHIYRTTRANKHLNAQTGVILITTLLFLLAITLLGICILKTCLLQTRMADYFKQKNYAFQKAETALLLAEANINKNNLFGKTTDNFSYSIVAQQPCAYKKCFLITAIGYHQGAKSILQSNYVEEVIKVPNDGESLRRFRSSWWEEG